jgi:hypothetical protein
VSQQSRPSLRHPLAARYLRRLVLVAGMLMLTIGVSACEIENRLQHPTYADGNQLYVYAGPMTYQVQITRALNPYSTEDVGYLAGVPDAQSLPPSDLWFGVFLWAKNQTKHYLTTSDTFDIVDSSGTVYHPVTLNPSINQYAWTAQRLAPDGVEPTPDTTAADGPTQGGLILFKLSDAIYSNRPLLLRIYAPGQAKPTRITLDL